MLDSILKSLGAEGVSVQITCDVGRLVTAHAFDSEHMFYKASGATIGDALTALQEKLRRGIMHD